MDRLSQYVTYVTPPQVGIGLGGSRSLDTPSPLPMTSPRPTIGVEIGTPSPQSIVSGGPIIGGGTNPPTTVVVHHVPQWGTSPHPDEPRREVSNPDLSRVKTPRFLAVTVEAEDGAVEAVVDVVEVVEVEVEEAVEEEATIPHHHPPPVQACPDNDKVDNEGIVFSTKLRHSNSWNKSCKIKSKRLLGAASQVSQPPTLSPPPIKTTVVSP